MAGLKRIRTGDFSIHSAITLGQLEEIRDKGEIENYLVSVEDVLDVYPKAQVYKKFDKLLYNGNPLLSSQFKMVGEEEKKLKKLRMYDAEGNFIGLYAYIREKKQWKPEKMFL